MDRERESILPKEGIVEQIPFDSDRKRMTVVTLDELVAAACDHVATLAGARARPAGLEEAPLAPPRLGAAERAGAATRRIAFVRCNKVASSAAVAPVRVTGPPPAPRGVV